MKLKCNICNQEPLDNSSIFFDVSESEFGKDDGCIRIDNVICVFCINDWIVDTGFDRINLIRRINNPDGGVNWQ